MFAGSVHRVSDESRRAVSDLRPPPPHTHTPRLETVRFSDETYCVRPTAYRFACGARARGRKQRRRNFDGPEGETTYRTVHTDTAACMCARSHTCQIAQSVAARRVYTGGGRRGLARYDVRTYYCRRARVPEVFLLIASRRRREGRGEGDRGGGEGGRLANFRRSHPFRFPVTCAPSPPAARRRPRRDNTRKRCNYAMHRRVASVFIVAPHSTVFISVYRRRLVPASCFSAGRRRLARPRVLTGGRNRIPTGEKQAIVTGN